MRVVANDSGLARRIKHEPQWRFSKAETYSVLGALSYIIWSFACRLLELENLIPPNVKLSSGEHLLHQTTKIIIIADALIENYAEME